MAWYITTYNLILNAHKRHKVRWWVSIWVVSSHEVVVESSSKKCTQRYIKDVSSRVNVPIPHIPVITELKAMSRLRRVQYIVTSIAQFQYLKFICLYDVACSTTFFGFFFIPLIGELLITHFDPNPMNVGLFHVSCFKNVWSRFDWMYSASVILLCVCRRKTHSFF